MKKRVTNILIFISILWIITIVDSILPFEFCQYGIVPRTLKGLIGIISAPLLHANFFHLLSNTLPLFVLLLVLFTFYTDDALDVVILSVLIGGSLVWIFGRASSHVGISGLIYSLAAFLILAGIIRKDIKLFLISLLIIFLYGGLIWGVFPTRYWISWEGHLFGAIAGFLLAYFLVKKKRTQNA